MAGRTLGKTSRRTRSPTTRSRVPSTTSVISIRSPFEVSLAGPSPSVPGSVTPTPSGVITSWLTTLPVRRSQHHSAFTPA